MEVECLIVAIKSNFLWGSPTTTMTMGSLVGLPIIAFRFGELEKELLILGVN